MGIETNLLRRPLVLGAGGFVGYHLSEHLSTLDEVEVVRAVDIEHAKNNESLRKLQKIEVQETLINYETIWEILKFQPTCVFALAALNGTSRFYSNPFQVIEYSTIPTLALLAKLDPSCPVVYSSSSEVYASNLNLGISLIPTPETTPLSIENIHNPRWSYAVAKIHGEMAVVSSSIEHGRKSAIVRYHNVYGPKMGLDHFIPDFVRRASFGRYEVQNADASRSFLYITDAIAGTISALFRADYTSPIFHLGSSDEKRIIEAAKRILELMNLGDREIQVIDGPSGSVQRRVPSIEKAQNVLNWNPVVSFDEGVQEYLKSEGIYLR